MLVLVLMVQLRPTTTTAAAVCESCCCCCRHVAAAGVCVHLGQVRYAAVVLLRGRRLRAVCRQLLRPVAAVSWVARLSCPGAHRAPCTGVRHAVLQVPGTPDKQGLLLLLLLLQRFDAGATCVHCAGCCCRGLGDAGGYVYATWGRDMALV